MNPKYIKEFYDNNKVDSEFDHEFYSRSVIKFTKKLSENLHKFAQPYCKDNSVTERERLYYHYELHGKKLGLFKSLEEMKKHFSIQEEKEDVDPTSKISVVCACMNREKMLKVSLQSWLNFDEVDEVVIIDYSSMNNLKYLEKTNNKIKVIRIEGQKYYNVAKANNLAVLNAKNDRVMKMDVDYVLNPYFNIFNIINKVIRRNNFIIGNCKLEQADNNLGFLRYLHGFLYIYKETFERFGRYNENFEGYGWEDSDIHAKLESNGLKKEFIPFDQLYIYHNPHNDNVRSENYENKNIEETFLSNQNYKNEDKKYKWIC